MPQCPCGSDLELNVCCGRYHAGEPAPTAEALMRARYAAYALARLDYIAATCAGPAAAEFNLLQAERSQLGTRWLGLEILRSRKGREVDGEGTVSFIAHFSQDGAVGKLRETSLFRRIDDRWFYWERYRESPELGMGGTGRNDMCPCGSGRKYKKCCG